MPGSQCVVILVLKLNECSSELGEVVIDEVCQLVAVEDGLLLENPDVSPCLDETAVNIPVGCVAYQIGSIVQEACRTDDFSVTCPFDIYHLGGSRTHENDQTVLLLLSMDMDGVQK